VSWVLGSLVDTEHAPAPIEWGQDDAEKVVLALLNSPLWPKTALFNSYDENGGFFDHLPPPVPSATDPKQRAGEFFDPSRMAATALSEGGAFVSEPVGLGFRVPALVISPFSRNPNPAGGPLVCSDTLDLTSTLRFVERVFGVPVPRRDPTNRIPGLSPWRVRNTGDMTTAFNFAAAPNTSAPTLPLTNRADPRVLAECPAPTGTLLSSSVSPGYPVPGTATMPTQEPSPGAVQRPSGPVSSSRCSPPSTTVSGITPAAHGDLIRAAVALPTAAIVAAIGSFLSRRGTHRGD
jgi:phospholipase C